MKSEMEWLKDYHELLTDDDILIDGRIVTALRKRIKELENDEEGGGK